MAKIPNFRRITPEDYDSDYQPLIETLGVNLNDFMKNVTDTINGNLDYSNITQKIITIDILVDSTGKPTGNNQINIGKNSPIGLQVIKITNKTSSSTFPKQVPFITYTELGNNLIRIENIQGLTAGHKYSLNIIVY